MREIFDSRIGNIQSFNITQKRFSVASSIRTAAES